MRRTADIVIIGAGVIGTATAYFLARRGMKNIVLLDKEGPGAGASGQSVDVVSMHCTTTHDARLVLKSLDLFINWPDAVGGECGFHTTGCVQVVSPHDVHHLKANVAMLQEVGVNTWVITPEELKLMQPFCRVDDVGAAAYEPDSGYADGWSTVHSLAQGARELGVCVLSKTPVTGLRVARGRIKGVQVGEEILETDRVLVAAGPWTRALCRTAGVELAVASRRHMAAVVQRPPEIPNHLVFMDAAAGMYCRSEWDSFTVVGLSHCDTEAEVDPDSYGRDMSADLRIEWARRLSWRMPAMERAGWRSHWVAVDGYTPDRHMMLGPVPGVEGLCVATGASGSGSRAGPAAGLCMAELISGGAAKTVDIYPLRPSRFEEGEPIVSQHEYTVPAMK